MVCWHLEGGGGGVVKDIESPEVGISARTDGLDFVQKHSVSVFVLFVTVTRVNASLF